LSRESAKQEVLLAAKKAYDEKLMAGTSGNMSVRVSGEDLVAITPSSYDYACMKLEDIVLIDFEGHVVEGKHRPSSEWKMHVAIYQEVKHANAIVHTHSPYATSFAVNHMDIPVILIEMNPFLKGSIEVSAYASQGSWEVGWNAVPILQEKNACLLANHGVVCIGEDMQAAYLAAVYTEDAAKIYHMAKTVGTPVVLESEK
jgi:L-ribulose-5-phosphate 4-epimerase